MRSSVFAICLLFVSRLRLGKIPPSPFRRSIRISMIRYVMWHLFASSPRSTSGTYAESGFGPVRQGSRAFGGGMACNFGRSALTVGLDTSLPISRVRSRTAGDTGCHELGSLELAFLWWTRTAGWGEANACVGLEPNTCRNRNSKRYERAGADFFHRHAEFLW